MELKIISTSDLTTFIASLPPTSGLFLQTSAWQKFEFSQGATVDSLGLLDQEKLVGIASVVERQLPGGFKYLYVPRGPLCQEDKYSDDFIQLLIKHYQTSGSVFLRIEPLDLSSDWLHATGFKATDSNQPTASLLLDLTQSTDKLLAVMHPKTRYNIRLAERKGLSWRLAGSEGLEDFWQLLKTTAQRDSFSSHTKDHYRLLLEQLGSEPLGSAEVSVRLAIVEHQNKLLAGSLLTFSHGVVTYLHGASSNEARELMPTYLLHWRSITEAKKQGFKLYDWWGISTPKHPKRSWEGITRFKKGFGGMIVDYPGTFDYPYHKHWYVFYCLARKILR
ncbi:MAG: peptidoglycan bridge formation glycyltransferase FemA/FemB family protein [Patescibacteria group bacterium]